MYIKKKRKAKRFQKESDIAVYWAKMATEKKTVYVCNKIKNEKKKEVGSCAEKLLVIGDCSISVCSSAGDSSRTRHVKNRSVNTKRVSEQQ